MANVEYLNWNDAVLGQMGETYVLVFSI